MDGCFIDDGMTRAFRIKEAPGFHGPLTGTYRPALYETVRRYQLSHRDDDAKAHAATSRKILAEHVLTWDAQLAGQPAKIDEAVLKKLHPALVGQLLDHVLGYTISEQAEAEKN